MSDDHRLVVGDVGTMPSNSYSRNNYGSLSRSWIDHSLLSKGLFSSMLNYRLLDDFAVSDYCGN